MNSGVLQMTTTRRTRRGLDERLAEIKKAEERALLRYQQKNAEAERLAAQKQERDRKLDTRRKIIAGALALEHAQRDPAFGAALQGLLNEYVTKLPERALFGLATIDPATGRPIETATDKGPLAAPRAQG